MKNPRGKISEDRALQINNNVAEEYLDHGDTSFATKAELCEVILWLEREMRKDLQRKDSALHEIFTLAIKARHYPRLDEESDKQEKT